MNANVGSVLRRVLSGAAFGFVGDRDEGLDAVYHLRPRIHLVGNSVHRRWNDFGRGDDRACLPPVALRPGPVVATPRLLLSSLGMAAGAVMVPSFVLGGIALGRKHWHPWTRILLAVLGGRVPGVRSSMEPNLSLMAEQSGRFRYTQGFSPSRPGRFRSSSVPSTEAPYPLLILNDRFS